MIKCKKCNEDMPPGTPVTMDVRNGYYIHADKCPSKLPRFYIVDQGKYEDE